MCVEAAIGSMALDMVHSAGDGQLQYYGMDVLTVAVLAILITAPIGALAIGLSGPKLLQTYTTTHQDTNRHGEKSSKSTLKIHSHLHSRQHACLCTSTHMNTHSWHTHTSSHDSRYWEHRFTCITAVFICCVCRSLCQISWCRRLGVQTVNMKYEHTRLWHCIHSIYTVTPSDGLATNYHK